MITVNGSHCRLTILYVLLCCPVLCSAQFFDSLEVKAGIQSFFSSKNYQPSWFVSNQYGTVADRKNDLSPFIRISNRHVIAEQEYQNDRGFYDYNDISVSYGLSVYNNDHFRSVIIEEAYGKLEYKNWSFRIGRFEETTGDIDPDISTGSLGISGNALPIPKIGIAVTDYTGLPFTNGWLQFKGTFAHGWMGNNRYIKNSYYHEKTFFLRIGPQHLKFYGGLEHFAEWGGKRGNGQSDKSWKGFKDVVLGKIATTAGDGTNHGTHEGDQRGVVEGGVYWDNNDIAIHGYLQKPFESMQYLSLRNKDLLAGIIISTKNESAGLQKIVFEFISTKNPDDHIAVNKRESLYNNSAYKTGWEYENNIIGTPLFINRIRGSNYFPGIQPYDWNSPDSTIPGNSNIINNRVFAIHMGVVYSFADRLQGKTLLTYTENYGSPAINEPFFNGNTQFYSLQQISYDIPKKNLTLTAGLGFDFGQLSKTAIAGGMLKIEWFIPFHDNANDSY